MSDVVARLSVLVETKITGDDKLKSLEASLKNTDAAGKRSAGGLQALSAAEARAVLTAGKLATEQQRTAVASGQAALNVQRLATEQSRTATTANQAAIAAQRLATEQQQTATAAARAERAMLQLAAAQERASRAAQNGGLGPALPRTLDGLSGSAANLAGTLGLAFSAKAVIDFGVAAGKSALTLASTERITRSLAGSTEVYNTVLTAAKRQQELFGGTIQENLDGLKGLIITSRSSGAELQKLIDLSQKLSVLDPEQGTAGARVAISEALSGDPRSLAARYEIPRSALAKIKDESLSATEKLQVLDDYLNKIGISGGVVADSVTKQAQAYNKLGAELDNVKNKIGTGLANLFAPVADKLGKELGFTDAFKGAQQEALAASTSYQAYTTAVAANTQAVEANAGVKANSALRGQQLTQSEFTYAQALIAQGTAVDQANQKALAMRQTFEELAVIKQQVAAGGNTLIGEADVASIAALADQAARVAAISPAAAANVQVLTSNFSNGAITATVYGSQLQMLEAAFIRSANAAALSTQREGERSAGTQQSAITTDQLTDSLTTLLSQTLETEVGTQKFSNAQRDLAALAGPVSGGLNANGDAALIMAQKYGIAIDKARELVAAQAAIAGLNARALSDQRAGERSGGSVSSFDALTKQRDGERRLAGEVRKRQNEQLQGDLAIARAKKDTAAEIALLRKQQQGLNASTAEYKQIEAQIIGIQSGKGGSRSGGGGRGGGGGGGVKLSDQQKANNRLLSDQAAYQDKVENAEKQHQQRLTDIVEEYEKKRKDAEEAYDLAKLDSRAAFYANLGNIEDDKLRQQLSAEYEQAAIDAQAVAAEKGADVAQAYLDARQKALEAQASRASAIAQAENDGDSGKAEYLRGVDRLYREAEAKRIEAAKNGDNSLAAQRQTALDAEAEKYSEQNGKLETTLQQSTDRRIAQWQREGKAIDANAAKMEQLGNAYGSRSASGAATSGETGKSTSDTQPAAKDTSQDVTDGLIEQMKTLIATAQGIIKAVGDSGRGVERAVSNLASTMR